MNIDAIIKAAEEEIIGLIGYGFTEDTREQVAAVLRRHFAGLEAERSAAIRICERLSGTDCIEDDARRSAAITKIIADSDNLLVSLPPLPKEAEHE